MLSLPRPTSASSTTPRRPPSSHRSSRSPSPTLTLASSIVGPPLSSPASSFAQLEPQPGYHHGQPRAGGWRAPVGVNRQSALVRGPKREVKSVERMSLDELSLTHARNALVLSDRSIFPSLPASSPPDPHQMRLQAMQEQVERQMGLLSTQEGVASLGIEEEAEGLVGEQRGGHQGGGRRRSSTPLSPVFRNPTPRKTGLTDPLGMDESLALQSQLFARERERQAAREEMLRRREEERLGVGSSAGGEKGVEGRKIKLNDELERVRMAARVRAFMNPKRPSFDSDEEVDEMDELTTAFEADDDDEEYDSGYEGDGNGGMMIISQEEVERSWVADR